ncbi:hypothetical protein ON010_g17733 [Phytophthora cinnamomi]|nr:hypothetical protein ON010_g17733 [Phytophthora cinnamomi]
MPSNIEMMTTTTSSHFRLRGNAMPKGSQMSETVMMNFRFGGADVTAAAAERRPRSNIGRNRSFHGGAVLHLLEAGGAVCEDPVGGLDIVYGGYWEATSGQIRHGRCGSGSAKMLLIKSLAWNRSTCTCGCVTEGATADIYELHFAADQTTYDEKWSTVFVEWSRETRLHFTYGAQDWTLFQLLVDCCGHQPVTPRKFKDVHKVTQLLMNDFRLRNLLVDMTPSRSSIEFLLASPNPYIPRDCISIGTGGLKLRENGIGRPTGERMEVDVSNFECGSQALHWSCQQGHPFNAPCPKSAVAENVRALAGRPLTNCHALNTEYTIRFLLNEEARSARPARRMAAGNACPPVE